MAKVTEVNTKNLSLVPKAYHLAEQIAKAIWSVKLGNVIFSRYSAMVNSNHPLKNLFEVLVFLLLDLHIQVPKT